MHTIANRSYSVYTDISYKCTYLSWDEQSLILWQQWRREGVERGQPEGRGDRVKALHGSTAHVHTYVSFHRNISYLVFHFYYTQYTHIVLR